jgi:glycogen synthase
VSNSPSKEQRTIGFVTFETEFAKSGGLGAVMGILPKEMSRRENRCFIIAPFFKNITSPDKLKGGGKIASYSRDQSFEFSTGQSNYTVNIVHLIGQDGFDTFLLASEGFFTAPSDPYVNPADPSKPVNSLNPVRPEKLVEDALFFYAAVPKALIALGKTANLLLHLQDWEAACVAQAIKNEKAFDSVACILTLHNPYDRYLGKGTASGLISEFVGYLGLDYDNVLAQMIPLVDGPLSTVSQNFADELLASPLHHKVFAAHLQTLLERKGLIGVDNGVFGKMGFPFSADAERQAEQGNFDLIRKEKWARREEVGSVLEEYQRKLAEGTQESWGAELVLSDPKLPIFLILGRDDPRQKGFDVVAAAVRMIPKGRARYIFTPVPGDEGMDGLSFLKKLAEERPGEIKVWPFRLGFELFNALQHGSSFMVMCSLYEPFGAATEAYLAGMPVVARATGGLVQQVAPYPSASLSRHGRQLVALFHDRNSDPSGFLFREPLVVNDEEGWKKIVECGYWQKTPKGDRVDDRKGVALFDAMAQRAAWAFQDAIDLYTSDQTGYAKMIYSGYKMLGRFSWERAVREYRRLYDRVCDV